MTAAADIPAAIDIAGGRGRATATRAPGRRLRVGVLVDLSLGPHSGGHVRCWERLAEAALGFADTLDLTVHFMGPAPARRALGETVRYIVEPPVFSTERLRFLALASDHTDLAPWHGRIARFLRQYDVIHTTDAYFAYARTAMRVSQRYDIPIGNSVHTNTPKVARVFTAQMVERLFGHGLVSTALLKRLRVADRIEAAMQRRLADYQSHCAYALVSRPDELEALRARLPGRAGLLRRGVDQRLFTPAKRDRAWLAAAHAIPSERFVVIFVGRLNRSKNVPFLIDAMAGLIARGIDAQLLCVGDGDERAAILRRLGSRATCAGSVTPEELARLYASADLFAFPSEIEESANVVLEAAASGLPALVAREGGMGRAILEGETGFVLPCETQSWIEAAAALAADPDRRDAMSRAARRHAERWTPSWAEVLRSDLLPWWQRAAFPRLQATGAAV
jgi:glycosyltransferase involved in cell wall biosynthesis